MKRRPALAAVVLLAAITLLAAGLRVYRLDAQSLWYDEAFSVYLARMDVPEIVARTAADIQPPLYYVLLHGVIGLVGEDERVVRGLSALFGVLAVPLLYVLGRQLSAANRHLAGLLAALLLAVSPLHIWYSQEARMYTLLVFLCLLSSVLLLAAARRAAGRLPLGSPDDSGQGVAQGGGPGLVDALLWLGFVAASVAALYTHYFALFVLAFQAIYLVVVWWGQGLRPAWLAAGGVAAGLAIGLAYVPWLPQLLTRYAIDNSFWPGRLRLGEVLVDIILSFIGGETLPEQPGLLLAAGVGLAVLVALLGLAAARRRPQAGRGDEPAAAPYPVLFILLNLLLPPALILVLSYDTPKFNARYVMIAQPALLLLLAGGLGALLPLRAEPRAAVARRGGVTAAAGALLAGLALAYVLGVSGYADRRAYGTPDFARPDFRAAIRYLRHHIEPGEAVILTSGHMYPVFDYYAPKQPRYLLPDSPTLDTTRTLDYDIGAELNRWLADPAQPRTGVWLVLWQDEVVDPVGYLTALLEEAGEEEPLTRTFPKVRLKHYRLAAGTRFPEGGRPAIAHPADFNFGNRLRLLGYEQSGENQVTLYWEALQPLDEDYRVAVVLRDTVGEEWGRWDGRPAAYLYPTTRWAVGQVVFGRYELPQVAGRPPGDYGVEVGVYTEADPAGLSVLDAAGNAQGKRAMLGAVTLRGYVVGGEQIEVANRAPDGGRIELGDGLALLGWELAPAEAQPGDALRLQLAWEASSRPSSIDGVQVLVVDAAGQTHDAGTFPPTNAWHPTSVWLPGQAWRGRLAFRVPIHAQPGEGRLAARLVDQSGSPLGPAADLGPVRVLPTSRLFVAPQPQVPREANLDGQVLLLGADVAPGPVAPGATLGVTLYWQALADMDVPYTVFIHLAAPGGQVLAQHDGQPVGGTRPTTGWVAGEYVVDAHQVALPADLPPGGYVIEVGLYDAGARNLPRLPVLGDEGQGQTDRVIFGPVQVK